MVDGILKNGFEKKKRVVHLIFSFTIGGAENLVVDFVNNQVTSYKVFLVVINNEYNKELLSEVNKKVKTILINRAVGSRNLFKILSLNYFLFKIKPDIIHCHNENAIRTLLLYKNKTVLTIHDVKMELSNLKGYKKLIAISKAVKEDVEVRSQHKLKAGMIYNAVDFLTVEAKESWIPEKDIKIIQVSRLLHEKKGQDILLKAICNLKTSKVFNNIKLYLIGSGPSFAFLEDLITKYSLNENVFLLSGKDRTWVHKNLKNYDILVQPSRYEGFGLTILEGIAAKIPVIASNLDGPKEILRNGEYGELFNTGNSIELAAKIEKVIGQYKAGDIEKKTDKAYRYAYKHFSLQSMLDSYKNVYNSLN